MKFFYHFLVLHEAKPVVAKQPASLSKPAAGLMAQIVLLGEVEQLVEVAYALLTVDQDYPNSRGHSRRCLFKV
jgi:hypothetical protein